MRQAAIVLGVFIKNRRRALNLSQKGLADLLAVPQTTVSRWELGDSVPPPRLERALALALEADPMEMHAAIQDERINRPTKKYFQALKEGTPPEQITRRSLGTYSDRFSNIKVLGEAAAGVPRDFYAESEPEFLREMIGEIPEGTFAVRVSGDSMTGRAWERTIPPGAIVVFQPAEGLPLDDLIGSVVFARLEGDELLIKQLQKQEQHFLLVSWNDNYKPITVNTESAQILGFAMFWMMLPRLKRYGF